MTAGYASQYFVDKMPVDVQFLMKHFEIEDDSAVTVVNQEISQAHYEKNNKLHALMDARWNGEYPTEAEFKNAKDEIKASFNQTITKIHAEQKFHDVAGMDKMAHAIILYKKTLRILKKNSTYKDNITGLIPDFKIKPKLNETTFMDYRNGIAGIDGSPTFKANLQSDISLLTTKITNGTMDTDRQMAMKSWVSTFLKKAPRVDDNDFSPLLRCEVDWLMTNYQIHRPTENKKNKKRKNKRK